MEGVIVSYRRGLHAQNLHQMVIKIESIDNREKAQKLVGKKAIWTSPAGKKIEGEILSAHGNSGAVRARFEPTLPGQAISQRVSVQ